MVELVRRTIDAYHEVSTNGPAAARQETELLVQRVGLKLALVCFPRLS